MTQYFILKHSGVTQKIHRKIKFDWGIWLKVRLHRFVCPDWSRARYTRMENLNDLLNRIDTGGSGVHPPVYSSGMDTLALQMLFYQFGYG